MKKILLAAGAALLAASASAYAQEPAKTAHLDKMAHAPARMAKAMDTNKDGAVDLAEFQAFAASKQKPRFDAMDKNGDGNVTFEEFTGASGEQAAALFKRMDVDGDGKLTKADADAKRAGRKAPATAPKPDTEAAPAAETAAPPAAE